MDKVHPFNRLPGHSQQYFGLVWLLDLLLFLGQSSSVERMRLYDGGDHLLLLRQKFFSERVHRFYLEDIQAITVRKDARWHLGTFFLLAALAGVVAFLVTPVTPPFLLAVLLWVALGLLCVLLVIHLMLGPTCITEVHTAVARVRLLNLERWRTARRLAQALGPRIREAQATDAAPAESELPLVTGNHSEPPMLMRRSGPLTPGDPRETIIFSSLLVVCVISATFDIFYYNTLKNIGDCVLYTVVLVVGAVGYGRIRRTRLPTGLKFVHVAGLTAIIVLYYVSQVAMTSRLMFSMVAEEALETETLVQPVIRVISLISVVIYGFLAAWGYWGAWRFRNSPQALRGYPDSV